MFGDFQARFAEHSESEFVEQSSYWDCGLAAFRACFRFCFEAKSDLHPRAWRRLLAIRGIKPNRYGVPLAAWGILGTDAGMMSVIVCGPSYKAAFQALKRGIAGSDQSRQGTALREFTKSLRISRRNGIPCRMYHRQHSVVRNLLANLHSGACVLMDIHCSEAYAIHTEDWTHCWAILPSGRGVIIVDPYRRRGRNEFGPNLWRACLAGSLRFDLRRWEGGFVAFRHPKK